MKTYKGIFGLDIDNPVIQIKVEINNFALQVVKGDLECQLNLYDSDNETFLLDPYINSLFFTREKIGVTAENMLTSQIGKFMMETASVLFQNLNSSFFINNIYLVFSIYIFDSYLYPGHNKEKVFTRPVNPPYKRIFGYGLLNLTEMLSQGKIIKGVTTNFDIPIYFIKDYKEENIQEGN